MRVSAKLKTALAARERAARLWLKADGTVTEEIAKLGADAEDAIPPELWGTGAEGLLNAEQASRDIIEIIQGL